MKLSIITINYNNKDGLQKTIDSVISQTWHDYEWIIIDGGSTDGSKELIIQYQKYFSYWCSEPDMGIYNAMNKGIGKAKGEYLNFMNSGDSYHSSVVLEKVFLTDRKADVMYGDVIRIGGECEDVHLYPNNISIHYLLTDGFCHQATFIKASLLKESGYRENFKIISDRYCFIEWFREGRCFHHLDFVVADYNMEGFSANSHDLLVTEKNKMFDEIFGQENHRWIEESIKMQQFYEMYNCDDMHRAFRIKEYGGNKLKFFFHWMLRLLNKTF